MAPRCKAGRKPSTSHSTNFFCPKFFSLFFEQDVYLTPSAWLVMFVPCALLLAAIIRNVPNRRTSRCCNIDVDDDFCDNDVLDVFFDNNDIGDIGCNKDVDGDIGDNNGVGGDVGCDENTCE